MMTVLQLQQFVKGMSALGVVTLLSSCGMPPKVVQGKPQSDASPMSIEQIAGSELEHLLLQEALTPLSSKVASGQLDDFQLADANAEVIARGVNDEIMAHSELFNAQIPQLIVQNEVRVQTAESIIADQVKNITGFEALMCSLQAKNLKIRFSKSLKLQKIAFSANVLRFNVGASRLLNALAAQLEQVAGDEKRILGIDEIQVVLTPMSPMQIQEKIYKPFFMESTQKTQKMRTPVIIEKNSKRVFIAYVHPLDFSSKIAEEFLRSALLESREKQKQHILNVDQLNLNFAKKAKGE